MIWCYRLMRWCYSLVDVYLMVIVLDDVIDSLCPSYHTDGHVHVVSRQTRSLS